MIESGHLEGSRGAYRLVTPIERLEVPATVQAVLAARIDRLAEREKRLLRVASVIGKDYSEPLLAAVAELPAAGGRTGPRERDQRSTCGSEPVDGLWPRLLRSRRRGEVPRVGDREPTRGTRDRGRRGANQCVGYLTDALAWAARFSEAIQTAEEGLTRFPRHIPRVGWLIGVSPHSWFSFWRGTCLNWTGRLREGLEELGRCRRLTEEDGTPKMAAYVLAWASHAYYHAHDVERALASARQLEEISRRLSEPPALVALTQVAFGYAHLAAGRAADAIEPARAALDAHGRVEKQHAGMSAQLLAEALLHSGDLSAAAAAAAEAIALCRRSLRGNLEAAAHGVMARALLCRDGPAARDAIEAALANAAALIERTGARTLAPALCEWRAELAAVLGDDVTRAQLLREAQELYD